MSVNTSDKNNTVKAGTMKRALSTLIIPALALSIAGCTTTNLPATFDLSTAAANVKVRPKRVTLVVQEPTVVQALASERIAVRSASGELAYLPDAQLSDTVPKLVLSKIVQSYENSGFASVGRTGDRLNAEVSVLVEIRAFELRDYGGTHAHVELSAKLLGETSGRVFATKVFTADAAAQTSPPSRAVAALDAALRTAMADLVTWTAKEL
jgi:cholesterol transport system auxiliary component